VGVKGGTVEEAFCCRGTCVEQPLGRADISGPTMKSHGNRVFDKSSQRGSSSFFMFIIQVLLYTKMKNEL